MKKHDAKIKAWLESRKARIERFIADEKANGTWDLTDEYWLPGPTGLIPLKKTLACMKT